MTEAEWLTCTTPGVMLDFLRRRYEETGVWKPRLFARLLGGQGPAPGSARCPPDRKFRLFACACCRRVWPLLMEERSRQALETGELFADGLAGEDALERAVIEARKVDEAAAKAVWILEGWGSELGTARGVEELFWRVNRAAHAAADAAERAAAVSASRVSLHGVIPAMSAALEGEQQAQCDLLRDLFGNPFRPVTVAPSWLSWHGGIVPKLARAIYEERRFRDLPILADALEEAGCDNADVLEHCRRPGEHSRGCWAVDAVLGRT